MQEKETIAHNMNEIVVEDGRNQYSDKYMFTEEASISAICFVCLKKLSASYAHACRKCRLSEIMWLCEYRKRR